jgi:hypothetical protein
MMMKRYALNLLLLLNATLALVLAWMWFAPDGSLRNAHWTAPPPRTANYSAMLPPLPGIASADTSQFIAMLDRPLFSSSRRPPPPPPPPPPAQAQAPVDNLSTARLSGLFFGDGVGGIIINIAGKHRRVRLNEGVDGWLLKSIQERSVTFARGDESRTLPLPRGALTTYTGLAPAPGQAAMNLATPGVSPLTPAAPSGGAAGAGAPAGAAPPRAVFGGTRR